MHKQMRFHFTKQRYNLWRLNEQKYANSLNFSFCSNQPILRAKGTRLNLIRKTILKQDVKFRFFSPSGSCAVFNDEFGENPFIPRIQPRETFISLLS